MVLIEMNHQGFAHVLEIRFLLISESLFNLHDSTQVLTSSFNYFLTHLSYASLVLLMFTCRLKEKKKRIYY